MGAFTFVKHAHISTVIINYTLCKGTIYNKSGSIFRSVRLGAASIKKIKLKVIILNVAKDLLHGIPS